MPIEGFRKRCVVSLPRLFAFAATLMIAAAAPAAEPIVRITYGNPLVVEEAKLDVRSAKTLRIPIGVPVRLEIRERRAPGAPVAMATSYKLSRQVVSNPVRFKDAVWADTAVLDFAGDEGRVLLGAHLGSASVAATTVSGGRTYRFNVEVVRPKSLGAPPAQYDAHIIEMAHRAGIPPSILKKQIEKETNFNPLSYRYEPLSPGGDFGAITAVGNPGGFNARVAHPYNRYRFATQADTTNAALPQGPDVRSADITIAAIGRLKVKRADGSVGTLDAQDRLVSARNVYEQNDARQNWSKSNPSSAAKVKIDPELLDFTAQTSLAASYGLMQIMYQTAVSIMHWKDGDRLANKPAINPSLLFDTPENMKNGDGSLSLGAEYDAQQYLRAHGADAPPLKSADELFASWYPALNYYNHGTTGCKNDVCSGKPSCYARCIVDDHARYMPVADGKVIQ